MSEILLPRSAYITRETWDKPRTYTWELRLAFKFGCASAVNVQHRSRERWRVRRVTINRWSFKETFKIWLLIQLCLLSVFQSKFPFELIILNGNWRQSLQTFLGGRIPLSDIFQMVFDLMVFGDIEFLGGFLSFPLGRFYTKDIFKDQFFLLKVNSYYHTPIFLLFPLSLLLFFFSKLYFFFLNYMLGINYHCLFTPFSNMTSN